MDKKIKVLFFSFLTVAFSFFSASSARADTWGANFGAEGMGQMMDEIQKMIHEFIVGAMQQMAAMKIDSNINNLVSGDSSSGSMFINDWNDYLRIAPQRESALFMNDFFTVTTRGRSSGLNYSSVCGRSFGRGNYSDYLVRQAKKRTTDIEMPQMDIQEYVCDAINMFENENWRAFNAFIDPNKVNNPIGFTLASQQTYLADREKRQKEAEIKAMAYQGYKPQTSGGRVTTPGSTIGAMVADAKDVSNKIVASADSIPQVIMSVVMGIVTETFQQGLGSAQSNIQREVGNRDSNYSQGMTSSLAGQSPEESFNQIDISQNSPAHLFYDIKQ